MEKFLRERWYPAGRPANRPGAILVFGRGSLPACRESKFVIASQRPVFLCSLPCSVTHAPTLRTSFTSAEWREPARAVFYGSDLKTDLIPGHQTYFHPLIEAASGRRHRRRYSRFEQTGQMLFSQCSGDRMRIVDQAHWESGALPTTIQKVQCQLTKKVRVYRRA